MNRRQFIVGGGLLALGTGFFIQKEIEQNTVQFRQRYIDQIVAENPSPFIDRVIYSHDDDFLLEDIPRNYAERTLQEPDISVKLVQDLYDGIGEAEAKNLLNSPGFTANFLELIQRIYRGFVTNDLERDINPPAVLLQFPYDFAKGQKSTLVFRKSAFEQESVLLNGKEIVIRIEDKIREILFHEYKHAEHNMKGLRLTSELYIDQSNYGKLNPEVRRFVDESKAFMDTVEHFSSAETSNPDFLRALASMGRFLKPLPSESDIAGLKPYEQRLVRHQLQRYEEIRQKYGSLRVEFKD